MTLSSVLKTEDRNGHPLRSQSNRTLLDIIRDDPNGAGNTKDGKRSWRHFREKLRLRRQGSGNSWTSTVPVPASDVPLQPSGSQRNRMMMTRRDSTRLNMSIAEGSAQPDVDLSTGVPRSRSAMLQRADSRAISRAGGRYGSARGFDDDAEDDEGHRVRVEVEEEESEDDGEGETAVVSGGGGEDNQPERMSLMALLAETDRQMGLDGSSYIIDEEEDDEEEEEVGGAGAGAGYNNCCVCMVRHKGAAFIPCGHTFCRLCSRELWVQRGNCPLCNNFILEILDIF
ncbi:OLC1v1006776C1 [Oldenlandia corymbosa var. corymbosa]|uniref:OLC1v1006776C1 n=1 Tax=Oldenlandia corymbosa var. corymbosa TaxID=529605 RepID=A0AAV1DHT3_OLDCO|nr:OLC1v1006776C1 [Oldenlandia corymbosa var. corymbosa]